MIARRPIALLLCAASLAACTPPDEGNPTPDAGVAIDAGTTDGAATIDALPTDAVSDDALRGDAVGLDAVGLDAVPGDAVGLDAVGLDAVPGDALPGDAGCGAGQAFCGGECVTVASDARHCGACGAACAAGLRCVAGLCAPACDTGRVVCPVGASALCVDIATDANHCGTCETRCPDGQVCVASRCACPAGSQLCAGACVDPLRDNGHCGGCGRACPTGQLCTAGACACPTGTTLCGGACVDAQSDVTNCGGCGTRCGAGQFCQAGRCGVTCASPRTACGADATLRCADTRVDVGDCGACGTACPTRPNATATCTAGACGLACVAGFRDCDGDAANGCEVDVRTATAHCGACGTACPARANATATCGASGCGFTCADGFADCDGSAANGCEVDLRSTSAHCGTCARACGAAEGCVAGACTASCGNGRLDGSESCDTAIGAGLPGACPTTCSPTGACSRATLTGAGTCAAACQATAITACASGDGCCPSGCSMARDADCAPCADECVVGATRCGTGGLQTCALSEGCYAWGAPAPCPGGLACADGHCTAASLTVSANTELCGVRWYTGDVVIQGGAQVTCATGYLEIHARSISVDPSSAIVMTPVLTSPRAPNGSSSTSYYCSGYTTTLCGGGGGGGGAGSGTGGIAGTVQCSFGGFCYSGPAGGGSSLSSRLYDDQAVLGGGGGAGCTTCSSTATCSLAGGRGGGVIRLEATSSILVSGALRASAEGGSAGATGSGGGGGGTILLRAPDVELAPTATVTARGGVGGGGGSTFCGLTTPMVFYLNGGNGGAGAVKVLTTTRYVNRGTIDPGASVVTGLAPPTVTSATHPDPNRYYNDGFAEMRVAWTPSAPGLPGYLTAFNAGSYPALSVATGTFTTATSAVFPASRFPTQGDYFFTASMLDAASAPSPVLTAYRVRVNSVPPTLSSVSHPSQTAWYPGRIVVVGWTLPALPADTFNGRLWYRVDHVSNTAPGRVAEGWTRTTAASLSLTTDASGAPLTDGIWYVHLAAEDAMGYLTRVAGHYRVQLGAEPARGNFFGYVENAAAVRQTGVTVTVEPLGLTATTDASGYFLFNNLYAGTYALTATRGGVTLGTATTTTASAPYTFRVP